VSVDKARKLIALAGNNPSAEEARTAAWQACRIIREGALVLLAPDDPRLRPAGSPSTGAGAARPRPSAPPQPRPAPPADPWKEHGTHGAPHATWPREPEPKPKGRRKKGPQPQPAVVDAPTACSAGRHTIPSGKRAWRMPDGRLLCGLCFNGCP
jgi:hypothetical protein